MCIMYSWCIRSLEEGVGSPVTGIIDVFESSCGAEN